MPQQRRIDAHHHLWHYSAAEYGWIDDSMQALRRDFVPAALVQAMQSAHVDGAIAVQARETLEETRWLLACAHHSPQIAGVVGWVPLEAPGVDATLDSLNDPILCGVREVLQGRPLGFLDQQTLDAGIRTLTERNLAYDLLIRAEQLGEAIRFVDRHPKQTFVLDHAAKPHIAAGELEPWRAHLTELAKRANVRCKLSGLVTEAKWHAWTLDSLRPYLDTCVDAFGPARLLAGSDWPVCLVASSYARWWQTLANYLGLFTASEQTQIFGQTALETYRLEPFTDTSEEKGSHGVG